jgi:bacteriocin biosynthesis cyclodehydratase domain-containing protein
VGSQGASINTPPAEVPPERMLRIIVGSYEPELIEHFTRDGQAHLLVGKLAGGVALCGPLVEPGITPCLHCLALAAEDRFGRFHSRLTASYGTSEELPIAIAHQLAAITAHAVLRFVDTGESALKGAQIHLNYLDPLTPTLTHLSRHPRCPCTWSNSSESGADRAAAAEIFDFAVR